MTYRVTSSLLKKSIDYNDISKTYKDIYALLIRNPKSRAKVKITYNPDKKYAHNKFPREDFAYWGMLSNGKKVIYIGSFGIPEYLLNSNGTRTKVNYQSIKDGDIPIGVYLYTGHKPPISGIIFDNVHMNPKVVKSPEKVKQDVIKRLKEMHSQGINVGKEFKKYVK